MTELNRNLNAVNKNGFKYAVVAGTDTMIDVDTFELVNRPAVINLPKEIVAELPVLIQIELATPPAEVAIAVPVDDLRDNKVFTHGFPARVIYHDGFANTVLTTKTINEGDKPKVLLNFIDQQIKDTDCTKVFFTGLVYTGTVNGVKQYMIQCEA